MEQSPWETNSSSVSRKISRILWNAKHHCRVHERSTVVPILSQINQFCGFSGCLFKVHFNIIFLSKRRSSKRSSSFRFFPPPHAPRLSHPWFFYVFDSWRGVWIMKRLIMQFSSASYSRSPSAFFIAVLWGTNLNMYIKQQAKSWSRRKRGNTYSRPNSMRHYLICSYFLLLLSGIYNTLWVWATSF